MKRITLLLAAALTVAAPALAQVTIRPAPYVNGAGTALGALTVPIAGIATTSTPGLSLINSTAATAGVQVQYSPALKWCGTADNSSVGHVSEVDCWMGQVVPSTAAGTTGASLVFYGSDAGGAFSERFRFTDPGSLIATAGANLGWSGRSIVNSPSDGVIVLQNQAQNDFARLDFGCTTSSCPALKRNTSSIDVRLADDSGYAFLTASGLQAVQGNITAGAGTGISIGATGNVVSQTYKVTVLSTNFIAAAVTADVTIATLPAKTFISGVFADLTQAFVCGSVCTTATLSMTCGRTAGGNEYLLSFDADAATGQFGLTQATIGASLKFATPQATLSGDLGAWSTTTPVQCRLTSGTGNLGTGAATNLSAGSITFYLTTTRMP